jgi:hypothetical protein
MKVYVRPWSQCGNYISSNEVIRSENKEDSRSLTIRVAYSNRILLADRESFPTFLCNEPFGWGIKRRSCSDLASVNLNHRSRIEIRSGDDQSLSG